ncbi:CIA30 family protein [Shimia abyssi]|nr:CIA30 family protein [Shimia abyssi]
MAEDLVIETFDSAPGTRWDYVADTVMGGVSTGQARFETERGVAFARLSGEVSTQNNGGFIQVRHRLQIPVPETAAGVRLIVRGNGEEYFVHLRTKGTRLPWQYYQAEFETTGEWREVQLPFDVFAPSGSLMRKTPTPGRVVSVGVVAFGRDHSARVDIREVGFYDR